MAREQQVTGQKNVLQKIEVTIQISIWLVKSSPEKGRGTPSCAQTRVFVSINVGYSLCHFQWKQIKVCEALSRPTPILQSMWGPCLQQDTNPQQLLKSDFGCVTAHKGETHCTAIRCPAHSSLRFLNPPPPPQLSHLLIPCAEIPWQSWIAKGQVYLVYWRCKQDLENKLQSTGKKRLSFGDFRPFWWRKWNENQQEWSRETQRNKSVSATSLTVTG